MPQNIFFPLRSNLSFFEKKSNQPPLISRIKHSILMYDNLIFEAGGYQFSYSDKGALELNIPPFNTEGNFPNVPEKPMTGFQLQIIDEQTKKKSLLIPHSEAKNYFVSFQNLVKELNIQNEKFIQFKYLQLNDLGEKMLKSSLKDGAKYKQSISGNQHYKSYVLKNFYKSLLYANLVKAPMMIDILHNSLLERLSSDFFSTADCRTEVLRKVNKLLRFNIPDFSSLEINKILDLRKDKLFLRFRKKLLEINDKLTSKGWSNIDISEIEPLFIQELIAEINEIAPSGKGLAINGCLGGISLFPGIGAAATGASFIRDAKQLYDFKKSWLAFIMEQQNSR